MRVSDCVSCQAFTCAYVRPESYIVPAVEVDPERVSLVMISEAAPADSAGMRKPPTGHEGRWGAIHS